MTGFVIDYEIMSKRCGECEQKKCSLEEDSAEFRTWYEGHQDVCSAIHVDHLVQWKNVYGSETQIKKEECINLVSKMLGTALKQTVKDWRVKGVTLGGKKRSREFEKKKRQ
ncbi:uncharacterized protein TNCV_918661 [Trichonephila clavipes]|nr:uncharacterized protein TNCV_918661 [Trichonephila clavipes]